MTEREAIVAWLRKEAGYWEAKSESEREPFGMRISYAAIAATRHKIANAIERGVHLGQHLGE